MDIRRVVPDIASNDMDASRTFYVDVFGFDVANAPDDLAPATTTCNRSVRLPDRECQHYISQ
jgi:hypothetical protein